MSLSVISPRIAGIIKEGGLYALRDKRGRIYNVSYSIEGLEWTTHLDEKPIWLKDAKFYTTMTHNSEMSWVSDSTSATPKVIVYGNTDKKPHFVVEYPYIPRDHFRANGRLDPVLQKAEYLYSKKALMLLY